MRHLITAAVALAIAQIVCATGQAGPGHTDPEQIRGAATRLVADRAAGAGDVFVTAGYLDPRLALARCAGELTPFLPPGAGIRARTTVGVRCDAPAWSVYLPVAVESDAPVLIARRPLRRGEVPLATDFQPGRRRVPGLASGFVADAAGLGRHRLRRPVVTGEALSTDALEVPPVVRRGQQATVVSRAGGIEVTVMAESLADGMPGDRVRLRNPVSGRSVEGVVQEDGTVAVGP